MEWTFEAKTEAEFERADEEGELTDLMLCDEMLEFLQEAEVGDGYDVELTGEEGEEYEDGQKFEVEVVWVDERPGVREVRFQGLIGWVINDEHVFWTDRDLNETEWSRER